MNPQENNENNSPLEVRRASILSFFPNEHDQWEFIDFVETLPFPENKKYILDSLFASSLQEKMPTLTKSKIKMIVNYITNQNKTKHITHLHLLHFLFLELNHKSIPLSWKHLATAYTNSEIISLFSSSEEEKSIHIKPNDFNDVLINKLSFHKLIVPEIYDQLMKEINKKYKRNVSLNDILSKVKEYSQKIYMQEDLTISNINNLSNINYGRTYTEKIDLECKRILKAFINIDNFKYFLKGEFSLLHKSNIDLYSFKETFIKGLNFSYPFGIIFFNKLKKNTKDLTIKISSIFEYMEKLSLKQNKEFNLHHFIQLLCTYYKSEKYLQLCLESMPYNKNGVTVIDFINVFKKYFPHISKNIIYYIPKSITHSKNGFITYMELISLLENNTSIKCSYILFVNMLCSYLDMNNLNTQDFLYNTIIKDENLRLHYEDISEGFKKRFELTNVHFKYLLQNNTITLKLLNHNIKAIRSNSILMQSNSTSNINELLSDQTLLNQIYKNNDSIQKEFNDIHIVNINADLSISVFELHNYFKNKLNNESISNNNDNLLFKILMAMKNNDNSQKGIIPYKKFINIFGILNIPLHLKYIAMSIIAYFNGNIKTYIEYRNLDINSILTPEDYEFKFFDDEMLGNKTLSDLMFKHFSYHDMFNIYDYIKAIKDIIKKTQYVPITQSKAIELMKQCIQDFEEVNKCEKKPFYFFYKDLDIQNSFGKIQTKIIELILRKQIDLGEQIMYIFINNFSLLKMVLFDLIKFTKFIQKYTRYKVTKMSLQTKIKEQYKKGYVEIRNKGRLNLCTYYKTMKELFGLNLFESIISFLSILEDKGNKYRHNYEIDIEKFYKMYDIEISSSNVTKENEDLDNDGEENNQSIEIKEYKENNCVRIKRKQIKPNEDRAGGKNNQKQSSKKYVEHNEEEDEEEGEYEEEAEEEYEEENEGGYEEEEEYEEEFKEEEMNNQINQITQSMLKTTNKKVKNKPQLNLAFHKLAFQAKLSSHDDLETFIEPFDKNNDGILSREELLEFLDSINVLNDSEKNLIVNHIDEYNLDNIPIRNLIKELNSVELTSDELKQIEQAIESADNFESQIDYDQLKSNFLSNEKKLKNITNDIDSQLLYYIQMDLYKNYDKDSIEKKFVDVSTQDEYILISVEDFLDIIFDIVDFKGVEYGEEHEVKLIKIAFSGLDKETKKSLYDQGYITFYPLLERAANFKIPDLPGIGNDKAKYNNNNINNNNNNKNEQHTINRKLDKLYSKRKVDLSKLNNSMNYSIQKGPNTLNTKSMLLNLFCFEDNTSDINSQDKQTDFQHFIDRIKNFKYKSNNYKITDDDYFKYQTDNGIEHKTTILTNEKAAIKKCEEIYNSLKEGELFFDKEFGSWPEQNDPSNKMGKTSIYYSLAPKGQVDPDLIEWYRPYEISKNPSFLTDNKEASEVVQGALGDCWFLSALAAMATKDHFIRGDFNENIFNEDKLSNKDIEMLSTGIFPPIFHYYRTKGIYCFRFFKNHKWVYVIIDDRLPCLKVIGKIKKPKLLFGKSRNPNQFWVSLIEKAYAKLHGCYEALVSGCVDDGIMDLTGQETMRISFELLQQHKLPNDILWEMIKGYNSIYFKRKETMKQLPKLSNTNNNNNVKENNTQDNTDSVTSVIVNKNNSLMICAVEANTPRQEISFEDEKTGLLFNHGYPILNAFEIPKPNSTKERKTSRLIRMKNSWGFKSWTGKWSRTSEEFEKNKDSLISALKAIDSEINVNDPSYFLICFQDFRQIFTKLYVGIEFQPKYVGFYYNEHWSNVFETCLPIESTEGFFSNPQYYLKVTSPLSIYVDITQNDPRLNQESGNYYPFAKILCRTSVVIMKTNRGKERLTSYNESDIVIASPVRIHKDNSIHHKLDVGEYIIIPCNCDKGKNSEFKFSIYVEDTLPENPGKDFMSKLQKSYVCKLPNPNDKDDVDLEPILIGMKNEKEMEQHNKEITDLLFHQFKESLNGKYD